MDSFNQFFGKNHFRVATPAQNPALYVGEIECLYGFTKRKNIGCPAVGQLVLLTNPFVELNPDVQLVPSVAQRSCQAPLVRLLLACK